MKIFRGFLLRFLSLFLVTVSLLALVSCGENSVAPENSFNPPKGTPSSTPPEETPKATTEPIRNGTPKKYFTLSFDDGITQDLRIIEILKKYNLDCCTFNINTGLYGANWDWVGQALGSPSLTHLRFTEAELKTGIYDGFDVAVHTLTHPSLKNYDNNPNEIIRQIEEDAKNIYSITGTMPVGMAWPGGDTEYTNTTIDIVYNNTSIRYARGITSTYKFTLPEYFLKWQPTCSFSDVSCMTLANKFIKSTCTEDMLFYVWCHGYELDFYNSYERFEKFIKMMSEAEDVVFVTNTEFYNLFKDEIPSWK